jgi:DNA-binding MarR family transcriptional regulator
MERGFLLLTLSVITTKIRSMNPKRQHPPQAANECDASASAAAGGAAQEAFLNVLKTADVLQNELAGVLKPGELSPTQYNVLRILRGAGAGGMPCGHIAGRMLSHDPDITRLLDRLESRALIERFRDKADRRVVRAQITAAGKKLLGRLDEPVMALHERQLGHLGARDLKMLAGLLGRARERT